jgi:hypothetical protein
MQTKEIVLSLSQDEFDTLGHALGLYLADEIQKYPHMVDLLQDDINLMHDFILLGYRLTDQDPADPFDFKVYIDATEWVEYIKSKAGDKPVKKKKK